MLGVFVLQNMGPKFFNCPSLALRTLPPKSQRTSPPTRNKHQLDTDKKESLPTELDDSGKGNLCSTERIF